jgi:hypothetical protein
MAKSKNLYASLPYGGRHPADGKLINFTHKDIKRECVIRGIPFEDVISNDAVYLSLYFREHFYDKTTPKRLDEFDAWQEKQIIESMKAKGRRVEAYATSPSLRLGFVGDTDAEGNILTTKRIKGIIKSPKVKRERTKNNIYKGTKKALTYQLQISGKSKAEAITEVMAAFPDANAKSISIWYNKSKKLNKNATFHKTVPVEAEIKPNLENNKESGKTKKAFRKKA